MLESSARRLCVLGLASALMVAGCSEEKAPAPEPAPTPLASLDTTTMEIPRIEFCQLVPDEAVRDALGGKPDSDSSYGNGDEVDLPGEGAQVVHEIGCSWSTDDGAAARAWIFARPVDAAFARTAVRSNRRVEGCTVAAGPAYGEQSVTQTCRLPDGAQRVRHAGLFGQTWLSCEVADRGARAGEIRQRADRWCVEVVNAMDTSG
jgi:hypothetical protein